MVWCHNSCTAILMEVFRALILSVSHDSSFYTCGSRINQQHCRFWECESRFGGLCITTTNLQLPSKHPNLGVQPASGLPTDRNTEILSTMPHTLHTGLTTISANYSEVQNHRRILQNILPSILSTQRLDAKISKNDRLVLVMIIMQHDILVGL